MQRILYLDQNAWIALAQGAWDKERYPHQHEALVRVGNAVKDGKVAAPLTFSSIYETMKVNDPVRRAHLARTQAILSGGQVLRGRRAILTETMSAFLADRLDLVRQGPAEGWFLSNLWIEAAADYSPTTFGFEISERVLSHIRGNPVETLFDYIVMSDNQIRTEAVRQYSAGSATIVREIENRRSLVAGEPIALRRRAYGARLIIDEIDLILESGRALGLPWTTVGDVGSSTIRAIVTEVPILNAERELVIRLEDQAKPVTENDLRDMAAFTAALPFADIVVGEKGFVNLARQARLSERHVTALLTSVLDLDSELLMG